MTTAHQGGHADDQIQRQISDRIDTSVRLGLQHAGVVLRHNLHRAGRVPSLGGVVDGQMQLSSERKTIVAGEWLRTSEVRPMFVLDTWVIIPNHVHGIIVITEMPHGRMTVETSRPRETSLNANRDVSTMQNRDVSTVVPFAPPDRLHGQKLSRHCDPRPRSDGEPDQGRMYQTHLGIGFDRVRVAATVL